VPEEVTLNEPEKPPSKKSKPAPKPESEQVETEPEVSLEMDKENCFQTPKKKWAEETQMNDLNQRSSRRARKQG